MHPRWRPSPAASPTPSAAALSAEAPWASKVDPIFERFTKGMSPGCAVGVYRAGQVIFEKGYGYANLEWSGANGPSTPFYIASMSKQFTAASILLLARENKLSLTDNVRKYIPELPPYGHKITIEELLHHTAGIRDYGLLLALSGHDDGDLVTSDDALWLISHQRGLNFPPGTKFSYTNAGYVLLGRVVERVSGKTLPSFDRERSFDPLGMADTYLKDDHTRVVPGRALGYRVGAGGAFHLAGGNSEIVGQGNVMSTIRDLAKWDANFYDPRVGGQELIEALRVRGQLSDGTRIDYARGLEEDVDESNGLPREVHNGGLDGYRSTMVRYPTVRTTIAVLCNDGEADADELAARVVRVVLADVKAAPRNRAPITTSDAPIDPAFAGVYLDRDTASLRVFDLEGSTLRMRTQIQGNGGQPLSHVAPSDFVVGQTRYSFAPANGSDPAKVVRKGSDGPATTFLKVDPMPPLEAPELAEYAGRYQSDELARDVELVVVGSKLFLRSFGGSLGNSPPLEPIDNDYFIVAGIGHAFKRDTHGAVTSLIVSDGRTRGVQLKKRH